MLITCNKCGERKPTSEFYGFNKRCRTCISKYWKEYYRTHKKQIYSKIKIKNRFKEKPISKYKMITTNIPDMFLPEYRINKPVSEDTMQITQSYCSKFGCGQKLSPLETLYGNKCFEHTVKLCRGKDYL